MKKNAAKIISIALCAVIIFGTVIFTRTELHGAVSNPLLYYNDRVWLREERLPLEKVLSIYYVPLSLIAQLNVDVYNNEKMKFFWIENGDLYITFDITSNFASLQDGSRLYIKTYKFYGEHYIPAQEVCKRLGLGFEMMTSEVTGETAIRVTDGSQKLTFEQLLRDKYPGFFADETTITTKETTPATSIPDTTSSPELTTSEIILGKRTIYLTIENSPGEYTDEILNVLNEFGYKATFFVIGDAAAENPALISRIAAQGHAIGLHTMSHDASRLTDAASILSDIEAENDLLYRIIKQKTHIWRAPEGSESLPAMTPEVEIELNHKGYIVWDYNIDLSRYASVSKAAQAAIDGIWDIETTVLRLCENQDTAAVLRLILAFISDNSESCSVRTISPAIYEINNVIK
jgi:peptidoglycan/xylan/chitin deacetylase (PgdA/CDA1 family)